MREWIVTNGLGGYSSLTHQNTNTRKYHGLLVSSLNPPTERWMFVSNVVDKVQINNKKIDLRNIRSSFNFDIFPTFTYQVGDVFIRKTIYMDHEKNTTIIRYMVSSEKPVSITHTPIVNSRHIYDVNSKRYNTFNQEVIENGISIKPDNIDKTLKIFIEDSTYKALNYWEEFYYDKDRERNEAWIDNNVQIGKFEKTIKKPSGYYMVFTLEEKVNIDPVKIYSKEIKRKKEILLKTDLPVKVNKLVLASDSFIVKKGKGKSVIAGYHWFGDWGRDTLIALPGLTLVTKRFEDAKQILLSLSKHCRNGLIPNAFMEKDSKAVYNTADASLWYIDRVYQYMKYTNDPDFLNEIWDTIQSIILGYIKGTDFGIHMDDDFLISHNPGLTWMDVKINDYYPTPRSNKAVEIQALWYNALRIMSNFAQLLNKKDRFLELSEKVRDSFTRQYDNQYDVIDTMDTSIRPNQIFLVSLDFNMIDEELQKKIVNDVQQHLLTIFGLRTLSPKDPNYKGLYIGNYNKDIAYHNGTVWPWLLGPFIKAFMKVEKHDVKSAELAYKNFIKPMLDVFNEKWDGSIYEIFDGSPVYAPRGCINQAWNVAEILRTWVEDIENITPKYEKMFYSPKIRV